MRHLISAILHTVILVISSVIVILAAEKIFQFDFQHQIKNTEMTVGQAVGFVNSDDEVTNQSIAQFYLGENTSKEFILSDGMLEYLNEHMVSGYVAKCWHYAIGIHIFAGILCLIFGVGFPFRLGRGKTLGDFADNLVGADGSATYTQTLFNTDGSYAGQITRSFRDTQSCLMTAVLLLLYGVFVVIWGALIEVVIIIDLIIFLISLIIKPLLAKKQPENAVNNSTATQTQATNVNNNYYNSAINNTLENKSLFDYEFTLNGARIHAPICTEELVCKNFVPCGNDVNFGAVSPDVCNTEHVFECINSKTGATILLCKLENYNDYPLNYGKAFGTNDLFFYRVSFSSKCKTNDKLDFKFFGGIQIGKTTFQEIIEKLGEPHYATDNSSLIVYYEHLENVSDKSDPTKQFVAFEFDENGIFETLTLDNYKL